METPREKVPGTVVVMASLSAGATIAVSVAYICVCAIALGFRHGDGSVDGLGGSAYFGHILYTTYFLEDQPDRLEGLLSSDTVFIFVLVILCAAVVTLIAATALIVCVSFGAAFKTVATISYVFASVSGAALVVDVVLAVLFGLDYSHVGNIMEASSAGVSINYMRDMVRLSALLLMAISVKGFAWHAVNIVLMILLCVYVYNHQQALKRQEHSIHKLGALNAFEEQQRRPEDPWNMHQDIQQDLDTPYKGYQLNYGFNNDERPSPRSNMRDSPVNNLNKYSGQFERSQSWNHTQPGSSGGLQAAARPFSYLEDNSRSASRAPRSPMEPQFRHDQWPPPVPAPDYSPPQQRRLKSVLKPVY